MVTKAVDKKVVANRPENGPPGKPAAATVDPAAQRIAELESQLRAALEQLAVSAGEKPKFLIVTNLHTSGVSWPSIQKDHPGYAVDANGTLSILPSDAQAEADNPWIKQMVKRSLVSLSYADAPLDEPDIEPNGFAELADKQRYEVLEIVYGPHENAFRLTHGRMFNSDNREDTRYYENKYVPMLKVARQYLTAKGLPGHEERVGWITEHLATLNSLNL